MCLQCTDLSCLIRLVTLDTSLLMLHVCDLSGGQNVSVKECVCVFVGSKIIPASSCASAYRASGQVGSVLI